MGLTKETKQEVINEYKVHDKDTGSAKVQVAMLTKRINTLADHFKHHVKDHGSRLGLLKMVNRRKKLLEYLHKNEAEGYKDIVSKLNLRK